MSPGSDRARLVGCGLLLLACGACGYTTRSDLAPHLKTVYVKPFGNRIDLTSWNTDATRFPTYRHGMEVELTDAVITRYQFTGLLRPASAERADSWLEGELLEFRRDALRYNDSQQVEEWRLSLVVTLRYRDKTTDDILWEEPGFTGDTTYFALGANAESESAAVTRAITDLARRIVERTVEAW